MKSVILMDGVFVLPKGEGMNKYNAEHYWDETAAIAIGRADKARQHVGKERIRRLAGLTYKIGEVVRIVWIGGMISTSRKQT